MKNLLSILLASFVLLSGMNLSVAKHLCGGEVYAVKISFSGAKATCGMEKDVNTCPEQDGIASNCCRNEVSIFTVDNYFSSTNFQVKEVNQPVFQLFYLPLLQSLYLIDPPFEAYSDVSPPDNLIASEVSLPKICVFRI